MLTPKDLEVIKEYRRDIRAKIQTLKCRDEVYDYIKYMCEKILDFPKDIAYKYAVEDEISKFIDTEVEKRLKEMAT